MVKVFIYGTIMSKILPIMDLGAKVSILPYSEMHDAAGLLAFTTNEDNFVFGFVVDLNNEQAAKLSREINTSFDSFTMVIREVILYNKDKSKKEVKERVYIYVGRFYPYQHNRRQICPFCGIIYYEYPALSRLDNETDICTKCGMKEGVSDAAISIIMDGKKNGV